MRWSAFRTLAYLGVTPFFLLSAPAAAQDGRFVSSCWDYLMRTAGYYGAGRYAFKSQDPRWQGLDPALIELLRRYSTVEGDRFGEILSLAKDLQLFGPWQNNDRQMFVYRPSSLTGEPELRYVGRGIQSTARVFHAPSGFPLKAHLHFSTMTGLGKVRFVAASLSHRRALAQMVAFWLTLLEENRIAEANMAFDRRYSHTADGYQDFFVIVLRSSEDLARWLLFLTLKPLIVGPLEGKVVAIFDRVYKSDEVGVEDILQDVPSLETRRTLARLYSTSRAMFSFHPKP